MCGIAGIVRFDGRPIREERLAAMLAHLRHRGPDGQGVSRHGRCALVHARLSIIDLLSGQQPMHLAAGPATDADPTTRTGHSGPLHLVFNGEVYNHRDLRATLEKRGHVFHSDHSDTEVLLYGYRQWGENLPKHLHGMFAFAIYDEAEQRLFVARDRAGKKPLYYRLSSDRRTLSFASLVATLVADARADGTAAPWPINHAALETYLRLGYTFGSSLLEGVEELPAAHFARWEADGRCEMRRYWQPPPISRHSTALGAADALEEVLIEAVDKRLEADVSLGCFLSGGIDSSLISAIAQQRLQKRGSDALRTYSVSMPDATYDETPHAIAVARHIGAQHTVLETRVDDAMVDLERLMAVTGEPTADSSLLPTHWLCKAARPFCKVALSGDGGDELFGGYDRYRGMRLLAKHHGWLQALPVDWFGGRGARAKSRRVRFGRLVGAAHAGAAPAQQYLQMIHLFTSKQLRELLPDRPPSDAWTAGVPDWPAGHDEAHSAMRWDFEHYLPFELLRKVDRAAMAVSLEVRCPMLDTAVCDLAGHLPTAVLMPGGGAKALLRQVARRYLPQPIVVRPKMGFAVPLDLWLRGHLRESLHARLFDGRLDTLGFARPGLERLFTEHMEQQADHTHRLFALLQLSLWLSWLEQPAPSVPPVGIELQ